MDKQKYYGDLSILFILVGTSVPMVLLAASAFYQSWLWFSGTVAFAIAAAWLAIYFDAKSKGPC